MDKSRARLPFFRRTLAALAVWAIGTGVLFAVGGASASGQESDFNPGVGSSISRVYRVDPKLGGLSFGITNGLALAGHQNTVAQGDSRAVDLGVIGLTLAGEGCDGGDPTYPAEDQPQAVTARSGEEGAAEGRESEEIPGTHQFARATTEPFGEAITTTAPFGVPGAFEVGSGIATSTSGVVGPGIREARSTTEFSEIVFGPDAVVMKGLKWESVHRTGAEESLAGSFTIEAMSIAGQSIDAEDAADAFEQANQALRVLGFEIESPKTRIVEGVVFVDPMRVGIIPSETRDNASGPVLEAAQPLRQQLFEQLIAYDCGNATYISIADIALGSVTAAGSLSFEFGGTQATGGEIDFFQFPGFSGGSLTPPPAATPTQTSTSTVGDGGSIGIGTTSDTAGAPATGGTEEPASAPGDGGGVEQAIPVASNVEGTRGGAMAAVAAAGLLMIAGLAEGDRRKMLRAQREIPMEMA